MRLLNAQTLTLHEFLEKEVASLPYAILSHTWLTKEEEVSFEDIQGDLEGYRNKPGYAKIKNCCEQAQAVKPKALDWVWVDTCCIDTSKEAELSQAIRSMWQWYADSAICFAVLAEVSGKTSTDSPSFSEAFKNDRYFKRAWTLQELLAPKALLVFSKSWDYIGTRMDLRKHIAEATRIDSKALDGTDKGRNAFSVAQKMCWAADRECTVSEDIAYCLLGIFNVSMPVLYGEGAKKAFLRLQEEIMKTTNDQSLLAWDPEPVEFGSEPGTNENATQNQRLIGPLASHPKLFRNSGDIHFFNPLNIPSPYSMAGDAMEFKLPLVPVTGERYQFTMMLFSCARGAQGGNGVVGIQVKKLHPASEQYARIAAPLTEGIDANQPRETRSILIRKEIILPDTTRSHPSRVTEFFVLPPKSHIPNETSFKAPDMSTWNPSLGPSWHVVCVLRETPHPRGKLTTRGHFLLIMGHDGAIDQIWCSTRPCPDENVLPDAVKRAWEAVTTGLCMSLKKAAIKRTLRVTITMTEATLVDDASTHNRTTKLEDQVVEREIPRRRLNIKDKTGIQETVGAEVGGSVDDIAMEDICSNTEENISDSEKKEVPVIVHVKIQSHYYGFEYLDRKLASGRTKAGEAFRGSCLERILQQVVNVIDRSARVSSS